MKRRIGLLTALAVSLLVIGVPAPAQACNLRWTGSSWSCI